MIDGNPAESVGHASDALSTIGTALGSSGAMAALGWLYIKSKLDGMSLLWKKLDEIRDRLETQRYQDAKDYATKDEVRKAVESLEQHIDKRLDALEKKLDSKEG